MGSGGSKSRFLGNFPFFSPKCAVLSVFLILKRKGNVRVMQMRRQSKIYSANLGQQTDRQAIQARPPCHEI